MLDIYTLAFCRAVTGLVFVISFLRKVRDLSVFERTILRFRLLPAWMNRAAAFLFLSGDLAYCWERVLTSRVCACCHAPRRFFHWSHVRSRERPPLSLQLLWAN